GGGVGGEVVGPESEPVLALERRCERGRDVVELRPVAERLLERRQGGQRIVGRRKDLGEAGRVHAEQDRSVLEERAAVAPLRAPDELASVHLDLAAASAREAERRRCLVATRGTDHLDRRAQRAEPGGQRAADPLVAVEE